MTQPTDQPERPEGAPDSPFFWRVTAAARTNDAELEKPDCELPAYLASLGIEIETVAYVAKERTAMAAAFAQLNVINLQTLLASAWVDGFTAGYRTERT